MGTLAGLLGRAWRFTRRYGALRLYRKVKERRDRNLAERGYEAWLFGQLPGEEELKKQREEKISFSPLISILVPAYETPEVFLRQMIDSVLEQSYGKLELCIADGSPSDRVRRTVEAYARRDSRVRYRKLSENLGISGNTNAALAEASGDYVGLLDHDDLLLPGALFEIVQALCRDGREPADAAYTDEDKLDPERGRHFQPHFKPDFNPEYLRSNNYICHFLPGEAGDCPAGRGVPGRVRRGPGSRFHLPLYGAGPEMSSTSRRCCIPGAAMRLPRRPIPESKLYAYEAGKRAVAAHLGADRKARRTPGYGKLWFLQGAVSGKSAILQKIF